MMREIVVLLFLLFHILDQLPRLVENTKRLFVADDALGAFLVMRNRTLLAEIMIAKRHYGVFKTFSAQMTRKGKLWFFFDFKVFFVLIAFFFVVLSGPDIHANAGIHTCQGILFSFLKALTFGGLLVFPFSFHLPTRFVVTAVVQELTLITETTKPSLFVIFTDVRLVIKPRCCTQKRWSSHRCECTTDLRRNYSWRFFLSF
mmetsp:Transcript_23529/g.40638  ORF Transcript_23529/g.40638 Transcript_23529/m.40638 type:complete len:202 (+) Transcript_23529:99-704(+)